MFVKKFMMMLLISLMIIGCSHNETNKSKADGRNNVVDDTITEKVDEKKDLNISLGDSVTIKDVLRFKFTKSQWTSEILPSDTENGYIYLSDIEGETYFVIKGKLKNLANVQIDPYYIQEGKMKINDKWEFDVKWRCEGTEHNNFDGNPKPLQELNLIAIASVSDEVKKEYKTATITMNILADSNKIKEIYSDSLNHKTYVMNFTK